MSGWKKFLSAMQTIFSSGSWEYDPATGESKKIDGGGWFDNAVNKYTGAGLTTAEIEANNFTALENQRNRDHSSKEAELAYERQLEMYDTRLSPAAQMKSQYEGMKEVGLNPALMYGGSMPSAQSPSVATAPTMGNVGSVSPNTLDIVSAITRLASLKSEIDLNKSQENKNNADAQKTSAEIPWIDVINGTNVESMKATIDKVRSDIDVNSSVIDKNIQSIAESMKRIDVMDSTIEVNGSIVNLNGSQKVLNDTRVMVEKLNAETIKKMLPYVEARQEAEIALANAKTDEARFSAESKMYDANLKMLQGLVDAKLIDSDYYDNIISSKNWDVRMKKREYHWKPVNDICYNTSMLMIGAGSVMSGAGSIMSGVGGAAQGLTNAAVGAQSLAPRNPIGYGR